MVWLVPPRVNPGFGVSISDLRKRKELFLEFLYYVFDSLLIPLVRSNFHVTESNLHKNRIFYFRHDVWKTLTEPSLSHIKLSMFEEVHLVKAKQILDARSLGFSQIRLLPKGNSVRPIMNLRRRVTELRNGKAVLGRSINSIMAPVSNMLTYERKLQPARVGSALFSIGDAYPKIKDFKNHLALNRKGPFRLHFAKADVKSCFDTIPQNEIVRLVEQLASEDEYRIRKHAEIKPTATHIHGANEASQRKPARKFVALAHASLDFQPFDEAVNTDFGVGKKDTIFVDNILHMSQRKTKLLGLLREHVERNIVKIGKKYFRQKEGIPQGSVVSSLLCNFFYAEMEKEFLGFLNPKETLLLRLIDDFLLITINQDHATRFLKIMHNGVESYGIRVNPAKSLANFETCINGARVTTLGGGTLFPYCGITINTNTLEITRDRDRAKGTGNCSLNRSWSYTHK